MSLFFSDFDNKQKQREQMRKEIDTLLNDDKTKLEDIFAIQSQEKQDEILNQFSGANKNVMLFFSKQQRLQELIDYLTVVPEASCTKDRGHKYPFLAHQLFSDGGDGVTELIDKFFYSYSVPKKQAVEEGFKEVVPVKDSEISKQDAPNAMQPLRIQGEDNIKQINDQNRNKNTVQQSPNIIGNDTNNGEDSSKPKSEEDNSHLNRQMAAKDNKEKSQAKGETEEGTDELSIFKNIENIVNGLNQAEQDTQKKKQHQKPNVKLENEAIEDADLERDDDSMEFAFEDAIDQPLNEEELKNTGVQQKQEHFNFEQIIEKIENPKNVKKSFELRYQNDDDDEIFIVHDGEEEGEQEKNDQDNLFLEPPSLSFNIIDDNKNEVKQGQDATSPAEEFEKIEFSLKDFHDATDGETEQSPIEFNPFIDSLANSEATPKTQKLISVEIQDNYLNKINNNEDSNSMTQKLAEHQAKSSSQNLSQSELLPEVKDNQLLESQEPDDVRSKQHQENLKKRKQKKGANLSIHQFDEKTQKSIQDVLRNINQAQDDNLLVVPNEDENESQKNKQQKSSHLGFSIVEDHIKNSPTSQKNQDSDQIDQQAETNDDELNDREEFVEPELHIQAFPVQNSNDQEDEEEDNILRKQAITINVQSQDDPSNQIELDQSPTSPISPGLLISPKFKDQESIELDISQKMEKKQDYTLINRFFSFLDVKLTDGLETEAKNIKEPLNSTLSGYFCRVTLIIISQQPQELLKYIEADDYKLIDKMLCYIDDKSICELISKILDEIMKHLIKRQDGGNPTLNQEDLAHSVANLNEQEKNLLQQSGQSSEKVDRDIKNEEMLNRAKAVIFSILSDKMGEESELTEKMGALEILLDLLKNKVCYQVLTTKQSFQIMTRILVSDNDDSKKNVYVLLKNLIQNYEKYERFEKRINIDNFDDEELMNSHSGSGSGILNRSKKSKNSRRQNQDVLKDIQESDLFQFIRVVMQEITSSEIETRFDQIQEANQNQTRLPLGMFFLTVIEFIEKASAVFSGFINDINQTLVDKDIFNYMFDILEYYQNSDVLNRSVVNILLNMMRSKSDDVPEMLKYLLEDTKLVNFLVNNGPKCLQTEIKQINVSGHNLSLSKQNNNDQSGGSGIEEQALPAASTTSPKQKKEQSTDGKGNEENGFNQKSPEQSSQIIEDSAKPVETTAELAKKFKVQVPCKNSSALQAHVKQISDVLLDLSKNQIASEKSASMAKSGYETQKAANQSQSGEQSKSSEIIIEDDDQMLKQNISKVVSINLNENSEWLSFVHNQIQPINRMLKGKLCEDQNASNSGFMNSDNQIFDDDFMRGNFDDDKVNPEALQKLSNEFDNIISSIDNNKSASNEQKTGEDDDKDVDHQKFFKKMSECLSSNLNKKIRVSNRNINMIDTHEREMKQQAFHSMEVSLSDNLRATLTDQVNDMDDLNRETTLMLGGRERSASNEFSLPPLQDFDDHRDQSNMEDQNYQNLMNQYKSNEKVEKLSVAHDLSAIAQVDDQDYSPQDSKAITHLTDDLALDDVDINLDDSDELDNVNNREDKLNAVDNDLNTFDDFANSLNQAIGNNDNIINNDSNLKIDTQSHRKAEIEDIKNIFEKIDEFDNIFGTLSPDAVSPNNLMEDDVAAIIQEPESNHQEYVGRKSMDKIGLSKSEIVVQMNNLVMQNIDDQGNGMNEDDPFGGSPQSDSMPEEQQVEGFFNQQQDLQAQQQETAGKVEKAVESEETPVINVFASQKNLSKSELIVNKSKNLLEETDYKPEFQDNQFWKLDAQQNYNIDELLKDIQDAEEETPQ